MGFHQDGFRLQSRLRVADRSLQLMMSGTHDEQVKYLITTTAGRAGDVKLDELGNQGAEVIGSSMFVCLSACLPAALSDILPCSCSSSKCSLNSSAASSTATVLSLL